MLDLKRFKLYRKVTTLIWILRNVENWQDWVKVRLATKQEETALRLRSGVRIIVGDDRGREILPFKELMEEKKRSCYPAIEDKDVLIDVGANIGAFSLISAKEGGRGVKVYAYEPHPKAYSRLVRNIKLTSLQKRVIAYNSGLSGEKGKRPLLTFSEEGTTAASFFEEHNKHSDGQFEVDVITLREVFDKNKIETCDILKMDCEGAEYEILFNTPEDYLKRIKNIILEYHKGVNPIRSYLKEKDFEVICKEKSSTRGLIYASNNKDS